MSWILERRIEELEKQLYDEKKRREYENFCRQQPKWKEIFVKEYLSGLGHSKLQIQKILFPSKQIKGYTREDISQAVALRSISSKAYELLRKDSILPLPSRTVLSKWLDTIPCEPGIQHYFLSIIEKVVCSSSDRHRQCVLLFDEMEITKQYEYDRKYPFLLLDT